jgi:hypothetical protein
MKKIMKGQVTLKALLMTTSLVGYNVVKAPITTLTQKALEGWAG